MSVETFDGATFDPAEDAERLGGQLRAVHDVIRDGAWRTLERVQEALAERGVRATLPSVSARLRELRRPERGAHTVRRRRAAPGLFEYRLEPRHHGGRDERATLHALR